MIRSYQRLAGTCGKQEGSYGLANWLLAPRLLTNSCLFVPDWNIGSKGIFKFENSKSRGKPEGILEIVAVVLEDCTIRDAKGWTVNDRNEVCFLFVRRGNFPSLKNYHSGK